MKKPLISDSCPESWKLSYTYDLIEVYGEKHNEGYSNAYKNRVNALTNSIKKYLNPDAKILDIAAGSGNLTVALSEYGYQMYWNDLREDLIPYVKLKEEENNIIYIPGNIFDLNLGGFDGIIISEIIEHVAHPDLFLEKVSGMVKIGGYIFVSTPLGSYFLNRLPKFSSFENPEVFEMKQFQPNADGHIFLLHLEEMINMGKRLGLQTVHKSVNNNPLTSGHIKLHYLLKILPNIIIRSVERFSAALPTMLSQFIHSNMVIVFKKV